MPDAYGNLLGIEDFIEGRTVRFHSYLDSVNLVLACGNIREAYIHDLSTGDTDGVTTWTICGVKDGGFELAAGSTVSGGRLIWQWNPDSDEPVWLEFYSGTGDFTFTVDMLDGGCWFALNNSDRSRVADVMESNPAEGNAVIAYPWHGGDNQRWRAEIV